MYQSSIAHFLKDYSQMAGAVAARPLGGKVKTPMTDKHSDAGLAALSICEALLLALNDANILPETEIMGVLRDAAATHENAVGSKGDVAKHRAAAALIRQIIAGGNSVRRT